MREVALVGRSAARHLRGDVYEVRVRRSGRAWRLLFSAEGNRQHILLALSGFEKKTQKTPDRELELAEARLRDWRQRGQSRRR
ncbi:MAG: type II toxin-antitoxin system RelE/ParE family toxin [Acidimicrobiales bacterium]